MLRPLPLVVLSLLAFGLAITVGADPLPRYTVEVQAPSRSYTSVPVSVVVPAVEPPAARGALVVRDLRTKNIVPCTALACGDEVEVTWIVDQIGKGEARRYRIAFTKKTRAPEDTWVSVGQPRDGAVEITVGDQPFTYYRFKDAPKPYCWPIIGPTGAAVTRAYPMEEVPGESHDHPHHRSFWFTFGEVNGHDFWAESDRSGRQVHQQFEVLESGGACGILRATNDWVSREGQKICEDVRELRVYSLSEVRLFDFTVTIKATEGPVEFGDTKEGMLGFRVASTMRLKGGDGHIVNSEGQQDDQTWGKSAAWCDYFGPVRGETVGIAVFDHPDNLRHPTYWHVRNYGLFAANPFGLRYFIGDKTGAGRYTLPEGEELTFRYRILIHRGTYEEARVADWYAQYANPPLVRVVAPGEDH